MSTARVAEDYVRKYFREKKQIELIPRKHPERGYDFRDKHSTLFVEVKGSTTPDVAKVLFRYFTNSEYEMAKRCLLEKKRYEVHLVLGVGTDSYKHFMVPGRDFIANAKPEVVWYLPVKKNFDKYCIGS